MTTFLNHIQIKDYSKLDKENLLFSSLAFEIPILQGEEKGQKILEFSWPISILRGKIRRENMENGDKITAYIGTTFPVGKLYEAASIGATAIKVKEKIDGFMFASTHLKFDPDTSLSSQSLVHQIQSSNYDNDPDYIHYEILPGLSEDMNENQEIYARLYFLMNFLMESDEPFIFGNDGFGSHLLPMGAKLVIEYTPFVIPVSNYILTCNIHFFSGEMA